jgi:glycosyltransferase involved in cell wall biosynthesis
MQVVPVGLDLERYNTYARRPTDGVLRIGFVGQIAPHKGIHLLVSAFRRLKTRGQPLELHIYGGLQVFPKYVETLRRLAGDDTRIHFLGRFENHRSHEVLSGIDVLVVPSTWYENRPMAILEAQASGTPVITAALGGMAEMVRDEVDGLHFLPDSVGDLERQLQRVLDEPELLPRLRAGISPPRNREDEMQQLMDIYAALVQRSVVL